MRHPIIASILAALILIVAPRYGGMSLAAEKDAGKADGSVKTAVKDVKGKVNDSWVTAKTKIALFADERVKGRQVDVDTKDGLVTLRGTVDSSDAKTAAEEIANRIDGVKGVQNELQVVTPPEMKAVKQDDKAVKRQVQERLSSDATLKAARIRVRTDAGMVTLQGEVPSVTDSARASQLAREVPGVRAVRNELKARS